MKPIPTSPYLKFTCGMRIELRATEEQEEEVSPTADDAAEREEATLISS